MSVIRFGNSAVNMTLPAFAAELTPCCSAAGHRCPPLSIDVLPARGAQQQTRRASSIEGNSKALPTNICVQLLRTQTARRYPHSPPPHVVILCAVQQSISPAGPATTAEFGPCWDRQTYARQMHTCIDDSSLLGRLRRQFQ